MKLGDMGKISGCATYTAIQLQDEEEEEGGSETDVAEADCGLVQHSSNSYAKLRSSPSILKRSGAGSQAGPGRKVGLVVGTGRLRQQHSLFPAGGTEPGSPINYALEAVKLAQVRGPWDETSRPSITSEESVSDYSEQVCEEEEGRERESSSHCSGGPGIWEEREVETGLRNLCFLTYKREEVWATVAGGDQQELADTAARLTEEKLCLGPALLLAVWKDQVEGVATLLELGADPNSRDNEWRTCLHLAASNDSVVAVRLLLDHKVPCNVFDISHRATPLFCAATVESSDTLPLLLAAGANVNLGLHEFGVSALHAAVRVNAVRNAELLLRCGAEPNSVVLFSETPLHTAAGLGYSDCVQLLLHWGAGTEIAMGEQARMSALHLAAQEGNTECVMHLLAAGAGVKAENGRGQSALHLAALAQSPETVELLLSKGADPDCEDQDRRTPLHSAIVKGSRSIECVRMLLDARANVNHQDSFGYAPLHIAALNEYSYCANLLLCYGADITSRTNGGTTALSMIVRKIPSVLPKFEDMLDQAITLAEHDINDVDCELKLDYKVLIPNKCRGESTMFMAFIETGHNHLLKHPLCESFLHLKWLKVRKFFFVSLAFHLIFTMLHTAFVLLVYSNQCVLKDNCRYGVNMTNFENVERIESFKSVNGSCFIPYEEQCRITWSTVVVWVLLIMSTLILSAKEIFQLMHSQKLYFFNWENWVQWGIIVNVVTVSFHRNPLLSIGRFTRLVARWQHHAAAVGVFLVWGELMLMVGRLPTFGIYVQMFTTVAKNFFKFLAAYFCLLVAFALSFCVLFPNYQSFNVRTVSALVKTLVMMAGEIEYENFIYENGDALFPFTGHFMILLFVVLISIILMNLLVGLAVSDIQGLQKSAGLDRLVRQTELISHIESMLFTRLLLCLPRKFLEVLHQNALVVPHAYNWTFVIRPNDIREDRLSREITESVHGLVARRYQSRKRRPFSRYTARPDKVRREKSFATGGSQVEDQLTEIRGNLVNIQGENTLLKRNIEAVKGHLETLVQSASKPRPTSPPSALSDKIHKSLRGAAPLLPEEPERPGSGGAVGKLVQKLRQADTAVPDNDSVKDLVHNMTNLALAITEDRNEATPDKKVPAEATLLAGKKKLQVSTSEGAGRGVGGGEDPKTPLPKYERKFHSLDKKLKRTNLMRRRESQALLEGIRKTRLSNTNVFAGLNGSSQT